MTTQPPSAKARAAALAAAALALLLAIGPADAQDAVQVSDPGESSAAQPADSAAAAAANSGAPPDAEDEPRMTDAERKAAERRAVTSEIDTTRDKLEKWVETRRLIAQEKQDLEESKQLLNERILLVEDEIESVRRQIAETKEKLADTDATYDEQKRQSERLKEASAALSSHIAALERRTKALLDRLPESLQGQVRVLRQQLPDDPEKTEVALTARYQNVIGILNEINRFNREITRTSETVPLPDGTSAQVTAVYLGVSQGYYVSANGSVAAVGATQDGKWSWTPANDAAPLVADVIAILRNEKVATFVPLPITLQ